MKLQDDPNAQFLSLDEAIEVSGWSKITILRAVSIYRGNRHSHGRKYAPGLRSSYRRRGNARVLTIRLDDLRNWMAERRAGGTRPGSVRAWAFLRSKRRWKAIYE